MKTYFYIIAILFLTACDNRVDNNNNKTEVTKNPQVTKQNVESNKTVNLVKVNSHTITNHVFGKNSQHFLKLLSGEKEKLIKQLIDDEIMVQYGLSQSNEHNFSNENERTKEGLRLVNKFISNKIKEQISDDNLTKIYEETKKTSYWHDELTQASQILVKTEDEAKSIIKELKNASDFNATFRKIAKEKSQDNSRKIGGYLGYFSDTIMVQPFRDALVKLKEPESYTEEPVKTKFGYHIILLHSRLARGYYPFKDVKKYIKAELEQDMRDKWLIEKLTELKKEAKITPLYDTNSSK